LYEQVISKTHAFPPVVTVHGIVSADNAGEFTSGLLHIALDIIKIVPAPMRVGVSSVCKGMKEDILYSFLARHRQDALRMRKVRMDAPIGKKANQVHLPAAGACVLKCLVQHWISIQFMVFNSFVDAHQVLIYDPSRTNVHMSDFRVTHLALREAHCQA